MPTPKVDECYFPGCTNEGSYLAGPKQELHLCNDHKRWQPEHALYSIRDQIEIHAKQQEHEALRTKPENIRELLAALKQVSHKSMVIKTGRLHGDVGIKYIADQAIKLIDNMAAMLADTGVNTKVKRNTGMALSDFDESLAEDEIFFIHDKQVKQHIESATARMRIGTIREITRVKRLEPVFAVKIRSTGDPDVDIKVVDSLQTAQGLKFIHNA